MATKWSDSNTLPKYQPATEEHFVSAIVVKTTEKQRNKCLVYMQVRRREAIVLVVEAWGKSQQSIGFRGNLQCRITHNQVTRDIISNS